MHLDQIANEIFAHYRDRYTCELKPGKAHLTANEIVGIVARHLPAPVTKIEITARARANIDIEDLAKKLKYLRDTNSFHF